MALIGLRASLLPIADSCVSAWPEGRGLQWLCAPALVVLPPCREVLPSLALLPLFPLNWLLFAAHACAAHGCVQDGTTALFLAAQKGHAPCVELLLSKGATVDQSVHVSEGLDQSVHVGEGLQGVGPPSPSTQGV
jgi:hypothetical protein